MQELNSTFQRLEVREERVALSSWQRKPPLPPKLPPKPLRARSASSSIENRGARPPSSSENRGARPPSSSVVLAGRKGPELNAFSSPARALSSLGFGGEFAAAAEAILRCDYLLVAAGAGFSADSGLAVYNDIARVPAYRKAGLSYTDLCNPAWLARDPAVFYGFWGSCLNSYMTTEPHDGYRIVAKWREQLVGRGKGQRVASARAATAGSSRRSFATAGEDVRSGTPALPSSRGRGEDESAAGTPGRGRAGRAGRAFVYTSNVDTAFAKAGLGGRDALLEIHGNILSWQCSTPCAHSLAAAGGGTWQLPADHRFLVDPVSMLAPPLKPARHGGDDGGDAAEIAPPAAGLAGPAATDTAHESRRLEAQPARLGSEPSRGQVSNYPTCAHCGKLARPAILMFDDSRWVETEAGPYEAWEERVCASVRRDPSKRLVILEGGCGLRVPTVRRNSERLLKMLAPYGAKLVRLNLDFPDARPTLAQHVVPIRSRCLPALQTIDRAIEARLAHGAARAACTSASRQRPPSGSALPTLYGRRQSA